jgi:RNA polymerase sigma-70 factor (ECF subfamily)
MAATDDDLLDQLKRRVPDTLRAVADAHARPLYRGARALGFCAEDADELVQDVFVTFMATLDRFEGRSQIRTWLFGILHRKAMERRRELADDARHDPIDEHFESQFDERGHWRTVPHGPERLAASAELARAIWECLDGVPGLQRQVFVLRETQQLDTAEVCKILGCTVTYMGVLLHRARARLRDCLQARGWESAS